MINQQLLDIAAAEQVPLLGVVPAALLADEPPGYRPSDVLPGAQSLVCFGVPVPRMVYRQPLNTREAIWRAQNLTYRRLDTLSLRLAALLEESGAGAIPVFGCFPLGLNERGDVTGYLNLIRMAEATGIGVRGRNGLLLHARYGSRLMLGGVVTTADLPALTWPDTAGPGCPPDCRLCVDACPVNAIDVDKKRVRIMRCLAYTARTPQISKLRFAFLKAWRPQAAARLLNRRAFDEHTFHVCSRCVACCPYGDGHPGPG